MVGNQPVKQKHKKMKKEYLDKFLDKAEQEKINAFVEDEIMFEAVRKVLLFNIYSSGTLLKGKPTDPLYNFALTLACVKNARNEEVGADVKAAYQGINALELGLNDLKMYRLEKMPEMKKNPAR